ncbi:Aspartokinase [Nowakowskiella sp. JEL0078]|nr:Aspartokinase [Nowakowskiella sp. JEL0078]
MSKSRKGLFFSKLANRQMTIRTTIVQKFGGTSVGTADRLLSVTDIVKATLTQHDVIVVLSAMSSIKKNEGTTSRLLEAANEVLAPNSTKYINIIDSIETAHLAAIGESISGPQNQNIRDEVEKDIKTECQRLRSFLAAAEIIDEISSRSRDIIISVGEKLSACIFTAVLKSHGVKAVYVNLEKLIEQHFESSEIDQKFYDYLSQQLAKLMKETTKGSRSVVPVVTGYFGPVPGGILGTIGRGYTDLTAALIAVGLKAQELQIWKEVDGIFTADPRKAPNARLLASITPEEAAELTYYGSEVIHPFTMEQVIRASIPIRIKNTFKPLGFGTVIVPDGMSELELVRSHLENSPLISSRSSSSGDGNGIHTPPPMALSSPGLHRSDSFASPDAINGTFKFEGLLSTTRHPTAVTIKDDVIVVNILSNRKSVAHGFLASIFATLDKYGIIIDLISTSEVHVSMALNPNVTEHRLELAIAELKRHGTVDVIRNLVILSLVGKHMKNLVGIASKMFTTLAKHKINIEMISQGASEINISCVIEAKKSTIALRAIHDSCIIANFRVTIIMVLVAKRWAVEEKLGSGSFGDVFGAVDIRSGELVAIKRESLERSPLYLQHEFKLYQLLWGGVGVPRVYFFGQEGSFNALVMERLGHSLKQWLQWSPDGTLPLRTVVYLIPEMVRRLQFVHSKGIVFRDVKPDQFCVGKAGENVSSNPTVYLIDFGLAEFYVDDSGKHIRTKKNKNRSKTGTARYASLNVHKGKDHTRRDDLESLAYVVIEMALGRLPWSGVQAISSADGWRKVCQAKEEAVIEDLCRSLPRQFFNLLDYTRNLRFADEPDYNMIISEFEKLFEQLGNMKAPVEWSLKPDIIPSPLPPEISHNSIGYYRQHIDISRTSTSYQSAQSSSSSMSQSTLAPPSPVPLTPPINNKSRYSGIRHLPQPLHIPPSQLPVPQNRMSPVSDPLNQKVSYPRPPNRPHATSGPPQFQRSLGNEPEVQKLQRNSYDSRKYQEREPGHKTRDYHSSRTSFTPSSHESMMRIPERDSQSAQQPFEYQKTSFINFDGNSPPKSQNGSTSYQQRSKTSRQAFEDVRGYPGLPSPPYVSSEEKKRNSFRYR